MKVVTQTEFAKLCDLPFRVIVDGVTRKIFDPKWMVEIGGRRYFRPSCVEKAKAAILATIRKRKNAAETGK